MLHIRPDASTNVSNYVHDIFDNVARLKSETAGWSLGGWLSGLGGSVFSDSPNRTAVCPSRYYALCGHQVSYLCVSTNDLTPTDPLGDCPDLVGPP